MRHHSGGSAAPRIVGNDVVDLEDPRCRGKHLDARFLARVFAPGERAVIVAAEDPEHALWLRWAAKESAYKVVTKRLGAPPPFTHAAFVVDETDPGVGVVSYDAHRVHFRTVQRRGPLHVVAVDTEAWPRADGSARLSFGVAPLPAHAVRHGAPVDESLGARFTPRERAVIHTFPSALVRLEARAQLARVLQVEERRLEIVCDVGAPGRSPPNVALDGRGAEADVSLSHHGRWVGWAVLSWKDDDGEPERRRSS